MLYYVAYIKCLIFSEKPKSALEATFIINIKADMPPLRHKNIMINIKQAIQDALDDPWSELRQLLVRNFEIHNIRHSSKEDLGPITVEIITNKVLVIENVVDNIKIGNLAKLFVQKVIVPPGTGPWDLNIALDDENVQRLLTRLRVPERFDSDEDSSNRAGVRRSHVTKRPLTIPSSGSGPSLQASEDSQLVDMELIPQSCRPDIDPTKKATVVGNVLSGIISKEDCYPYDLIMCLEKYKDSTILIDKVQDRDGHNVLHMTIVAQAMEYLKVVFYLNLWTPLRDQLVEDGKGYSGFTPRGIAEKLLFKAKGPKVLDEYDFYDQLSYSMTDLHKASLAGRKDFVEHVVSKTPESIQETDNNNSNCIFYASAGGNVEVVQFLLSKGADATLINGRKENCLHIATYLGRTHVVDALLKLKIDAFTRDEAKFRAVDYTAVNGDEDTINVYRRHGVKLDDRLVSLAAKYKRLSMIKFMIETCSLSTQGLDDQRRTPLLNAVYCSHLESTKYLVSQGADLLQKDKQHRNMLHLLADQYKPDGEKGRVLPYLLDLAKEKCCLLKLVNSQDKFCGRELILLVRGRDKGRKAWHFVDVKRHLFSLFKKKLASGSIDVKVFGQILFSGFGRSPGKEVSQEVWPKTFDSAIKTTHGGK